MIKELENKEMILDPSCRIADSADLIGDIKIGAYSSIWYHATLRGDVGKIIIGENCCIQDNVVMHENVKIGNNVSVGHGAIVHGCNIGNNCLIGMGSIIMNGVNIGDHCIIGAGTLILENTIIPPYSLVVGSPSRIIKTIDESYMNKLDKSIELYKKLSIEQLPLINKM